MDPTSDGHAGLGGGGGPLELGGQGEGRVGGAAPGPEVRPPHDDDDGRGGAVQDVLEEEVEGGHHWRSR